MNNENFMPSILAVQNTEMQRLESWSKFPVSWNIKFPATIHMFTIIMRIIINLNAYWIHDKLIVIINYKTCRHYGLRWHQTRWKRSFTWFMTSLKWQLSLLLIKWMRPNIQIELKDWNFFLALSLSIQSDN